MSPESDLRNPTHQTTQATKLQKIYRIPTHPNPSPLPSLPLNPTQNPTMPPRLRLTGFQRPLLLLHLQSRTIQTQHPTITKPNIPSPNSSATNVTRPADTADPNTLQESVEDGEVKHHMQAPNRATTWSRSQQPRELGMVGPRFENTIMESQPAPYAAIELIHKQPVRFSEKRVVVCDGGLCPLPHPPPPSLRSILAVIGS